MATNDTESVLNSKFVQSDAVLTAVVKSLRKLSEELTEYVMFNISLSQEEYRFAVGKNSGIHVALERIAQEVKKFYKEEE